MNKITTEIIEKLRQCYPDARPMLDYSNSFELLIAAMLSAQATDKQVNIVTKQLFADQPAPKDYLRLDQKELADKIRSVGIANNKAKNIIAACRVLVEVFAAEVPANMEDLLKLPGVGRKTANVVLSNAFGIPAIAVDTHVFRVTNRIGIVQADNVVETERQLQKALDRNVWSLAHHLFIFHGRSVCKARKPLCEECALSNICMKRIKRA